MQYFIFFAPGVGGDGFTNLLEHAKNIIRADGQYNPSWRIDKKFENKTKFYGAKWTLKSPYPFRTNAMSVNNIKLHPVYLNLIKQKKNTLIPVHYVYKEQIKNFPFRDIVETDQVKIHLYSSNIERQVLDCKIKNQSNQNTNVVTATRKLSIELADTSYYDIHIDIEEVWKNWDYLNEKLKLLNIELDKSYYDEYLNIINEKYIPA